MRPCWLPLLLGLLFAPSAAAEGVLSPEQLPAGARVVEPSLMATLDWSQALRQERAAWQAAVGDPEAVIDKVQALASEAPSVLTEAGLIELVELLRVQPESQVVDAALAELSEWRSGVFRPHPESRHHLVVAYGVADRARGALEERRLRQRSAGHLWALIEGDLQRLQRAADRAPADHAALRMALEELPDEQLLTLRSSLHVATLEPDFAATLALRLDDPELISHALTGASEPDQLTLLNRLHRLPLAQALQLATEAERVPSLRSAAVLARVPLARQDSAVTEDFWQRLGDAETGDSAAQALVAVAPPDLRERLLEELGQSDHGLRQRHLLLVARLLEDPEFWAQLQSESVLGRLPGPLAAQVRAW